MILDRDVPVGNLRIHCRIDEPEVGSRLPWLVLSNSLMTDLGLWDDQVAAFGDRFRILRYDQRGHGASGVPDADCSFDLLANDLAVLFDHFGIDRAVVAGVSMGGITALRFASLHPERVAALVVSDCTAAAAPGAGVAWDERIALAATGGMAALAAPTVERWFRPQRLRDGSAAVERVRGMIARTPVLGFSRSAAALKSFDFSTDLKALRCPTLMLAGDGDGALPQVMQKMAMDVDGAEFVAIPDAGHLPNIERHDEFNRVLDAFLRRTA